MQHVTRTGSRGGITMPISISSGASLNHATIIGRPLLPPHEHGEGIRGGYAREKMNFYPINQELLLL
jgi:hypothetical protein